MTVVFFGDSDIFQFLSGFQALASSLPPASQIGELSIPFRIPGGDLCRLRQHGVRGLSIPFRIPDMPDLFIRRG